MLSQPSLLYNPEITRYDLDLSQSPMFQMQPQASVKPLNYPQTLLTEYALAPFEDILYASRI